MHSASARNPVGGQASECCALGAEDGSGSALAISLLAFLMLIAAGLGDYYHAQQIRSWAYKAASEAARVGSQQIDLAYYLSSGSTRLDSGLAQATATARVQAETFPAGASLAQVDVRVLPAGGTISHFPPVARAEMSGRTDWTEARPAVGVYMELAMSPRLLGLVNGGQPVLLHVFASATAETPP